MTSNASSSTNNYPNGEVQRSSTPGELLIRLQQENEHLRKELDVKESKLQAQMNSIKTFWSPELKQERRLRKEERSMVVTLQDQMNLLQEEQQHSQLTIQALHDELRTQRDLNQMIQEDFSNRSNEVFNVPESSRYLQEENDRIMREYDLLRSTVEELEGRIEAQREILFTRDESVKKLLEMLQCKGNQKDQSSASSNEDTLMIASLKIELSECESRVSHLKFLIEEKDGEILRLKEMKSDEDASSEIYKRNATLEIRNRSLENELNLLKRDKDEEQVERSGDDEELKDLKKKSLVLKNHIEQLKSMVKMKDSEMITLQTRWDTLNNQQTDNRHHIEVLKESLHAKDQSINILQSEIDSLRYRVEEKETLLTQKQDQILKIQEERSNSGSELQHLKETVEVKDRKMTVLHKKIERLADVLHEKEIRLHEMNEKLSKITNETSTSDSVLVVMEEALTEKDRLMKDLEKKILDYKKIFKDEEEKKLQLEDKLNNYEIQFESLESEVNDLRQQLASSSRSVAKKDAKIVQLEANLQQATNANMKLNKEFNEYQDLNDKEKISEEFLDQIRSLEVKLNEKESQVTQSQREIDRILDILKETEDEKHRKDTAIKNLEKINKEKMMELKSLNKQMLEDIKTKTRDEELNRFVGKLKDKDVRIEELEEALRESVRMTTDREDSLSSERNTRRKFEQKTEELTIDLKRTKSCLEDLKKKAESNKLELAERGENLKKIKIENKKISEELVAQKQEVLVLAISEKDSNIALLERFRGTTNEIVKLKKEKEKLIHQLKLQTMQYNSKERESNSMNCSKNKEDEGIWA